MRCSRSIVVGAVCAVLLDGGPASAQEWCEIPYWDPWPATAMPIKWRLNTSAAGSIQNLCDFSAEWGCNTVADVRQVLEGVFAEIRNASGGKIEFIYDGPTTQPPGTHLTGGTADCSAIAPYGCLHIWHDPSCSGGGWATASPPDWAGIYFCTGVGQPDPFTPWERRYPGDALSLYSVAMQEVMHVLGMWHYEDCGSTSVGVMATVYTEQASQHLSSVDIHYLDWHYAAGRDNRVGNRWSSDALTWSANSSISTSFQGRFAATNNLRSTSLFLAWLSVGPPFYETFRVARFDDNGWAFLATLDPTGLARYHPGIANDGPSGVFVHHAANYNPTTANYDIVQRASGNGGISFGSATPVSSFPTVMPGVSMTFDWGSGQTISVWRTGGTGPNGNGRIHYKISGSPDGELQLQAADTPSIACGPPWVVGTYRCLLAYPSIDTWGHLVKWTQCTVAGPLSNQTLDCPNPIKTHNYYTVGSPSVAYSASSSTAYPWHIALSQGGVSIFTWRKGPNNADNFQNQKSFSYGSPAILPAAASRVFTSPPYRRYVFVPYFNL